MALALVELRVITTNCSRYWSGLLHDIAQWGWHSTGIIKSLSLQGHTPNTLHRAGYVSRSALRELTQGRNFHSSFPGIGAVSLYWTALSAISEGRSWLPLLEKDVATSPELVRFLTVPKKCDAPLTSVVPCLK